MTEVGDRLIKSAKQAAHIARMGEAGVLLNSDKLMIGISGHINEHYGPRCSDFDPDCMTCKMWAALDVIGLGLENAGAFSTSTD